MKFRRHHNNKATRSTQRGKRIEEIKRIAKKLNIPYGEGTTKDESKN